MKDQDFYSGLCSFGWGSGSVHTAFSTLVALCLVFLVLVKYFFLLSQSGVSRLVLLAHEMFVFRFRTALRSSIRQSASPKPRCGRHRVPLPVLHVGLSAQPLSAHRVTLGCLTSLTCKARGQSGHQPPAGQGLKCSKHKKLGPDCAQVGHGGFYV